MAEHHSDKQSKLVNKELDQQAYNDTSEKKSTSKNRIFGIDYYLISTVSLAAISLCALIVSIYQTSVLSGQQEVMDEQQKIMRNQQELMQQNAKAQLWPRLRVDGSISLEDDNVNELQFGLANEGTGPAIIKYVAVGYNGRYATSWYDLFFQANVLDSIPFMINSQPINNRVIQAGERYTYLSLDENPPLMNRVYQDNIDGEGLEIVLCYCSVFDEYWMIEGKISSLASTAPTPVDSCIVDQKPLFLN